MGEAGVTLYRVVMEGLCGQIVFKQTALRMEEASHASIPEWTIPGRKALTWDSVQCASGNSNSPGH